MDRDHDPPSAGAARPPLPEGYYLDNLESLLRFVAERSDDLLIDEERRFIHEFFALPVDARRLWTRLVMRRGPRFRVDRLRYREIDLPLAIEALLSGGFARRGEEADLGELLGKLRSDELRRLALTCGAAFRAGALRDELLEGTLGAVERAGAQARLRAGFPLIEPLRLAELETCRVLFFGNFSQSLEQFVLRDIGFVRFEGYDLESSGRRFETRADLEDVRRMRELRAAVAEVCAGGELEKILGKGKEVLAVAPSLRPAAVRYLDDVLVAVARGLERAGELGSALEFYSLASRPPARERRVRCLLALSRRAEADALVAEMHRGPLDESERVFAARRMPIPVRRPRQRASRAFEEWTVAVKPGGEASIEARSLEALIDRGYRGAFAENWLWRSLFGLAFWEETWAPIPGAFAHPFQYGPLDLHDGFRERREPAITRRLQKLEQDPAPGPALLCRWQDKRGTASSLVSFLPELFPALQLACSSIPGRTLAGVFERFSRDIARYGTGFPDLFLVDTDGNPLVAEVKGPNDVLRPEQIGWLRHFNEVGLRAVVVLARPTG
jgi:hypothetical protein